MDDRVVVPRRSLPRTKAGLARSFTSSNRPAALAQRRHDQQLLKRFIQDRELVIEGLGIASGQSALFWNLRRKQLNTQTHPLVRKRCGEVAKLIPNTRSRLGEKTALRFNQYAADAGWPGGHRRHIVEANRFGGFLRRQAS